MSEIRIARPGIENYDGANGAERAATVSVNEIVNHTITSPNFF